MSSPLERMRKTGLKVDGPSPDTAALETVLADINGRAQTHTLVSAGELARLAADAETRCDAHGIPKTKRIGVSLDYRPGWAGKSSSQIRGPRITTRVTLRRTRACWRLVHAERAKIFPGTPDIDTLSLPDAALLSVLKKALKGTTAETATDITPEVLTLSLTLTRGIVHQGVSIDTLRTMFTTSLALVAAERDGSSSHARLEAESAFRAALEQVAAAGPLSIPDT